MGDMELKIFWLILKSIGFFYLSIGIQQPLPKTLPPSFVSFYS